MKTLPETPLHVVPASGGSAPFNGGRNVDIVGVTGSIPVAPTILSRTYQEATKFPAGSTNLDDPVERKVREYVTRPDGSIDQARVQRAIKTEMRRLKRIEEDRDKLRTMRETLDRLVAAMENTVSKAIERPSRLLDLRRKVRGEYLVALGEAKGTPPPVDRMRHAVWFDMQRIDMRDDDGMIAFGKELVDDGLVRLPFTETVFVFPSATPDGKEFPTAALFQQTGKQILAPAFLAFGPSAPAGVYGNEGNQLPDQLYYALAVLSSRSTITTRRSIADDAEVADLYRGDSYFAVTLTPPRHWQVGDPRSHASPRLHWRRGHIRRLPDRTIWIRPMLVGKSENGVIVHDYVA